MDLFAQPPLGPDAHATTYQQHPDHQFGVDRRAAGGAVVRRQNGADAGQIDKPINLAQHMISRKMLLQIELIE